MFSFKKIFLDGYSVIKSEFSSNNSNDSEINANNKKWQLTKKIFFRFFFCYFMIYFFIEDRFYDDIIPWVGKTILLIPYDITEKPNGSGDTTYNYVQIFIIFVISLLGSFIWGILDSKRYNYERLNYFFKIILRYYLSLRLLSYGYYKVVANQFPYPSLNRMTETFGDFSPMGLAWTFIGFSQPYNLFIGMGEFIGGFLLLFRPTVTLASVICIAIMSNVFMFNLFYDIPVKIFSFHLLLISMILLANDSKRFLDFFIFNRTAEKVELANPFKNKYLNRASVVIKFLVILSLLSFNNILKIKKQKEKPFLYGIYNVEIFKLNNKELPPLITDKKRWMKLIINNKNWASIRMMDNSRYPNSLKGNDCCKFIIYPDKKQIKFGHYGYDDDKEKYNKDNTLSYSTSGDYFFLKGKVDNEFLEMKLKKIDLKTIPLMNRGFHWINETPYVR